jgi:hypothetical protein
MNDYQEILKIKIQTPRAAARFPLYSSPFFSSLSSLHPSRAVASASRCQRISCTTRFALPDAAPMTAAVRLACSSTPSSTCTCTRPGCAWGTAEPPTHAETLAELRAKNNEIQRRYRKRRREKAVQQEAEHRHA